jgi:quinoprotein glucose dehydrogenase
MLYVASSNSAPAALGLVKPSPERSDMDWIGGTAPQPGGGRVGGVTVQGLSIFKPPYGTISAINLDKGDIVWQIAHGETPDAVRNNETLKTMNIPRTGQGGFLVATLVTKTLVVAGDPQVTSPPGRPRGAMLRAYDKTTGAEVGSVLLPAPPSGALMTYAVNGRQYIVVPVSGGPYSGEFIALRLPGNGGH